MTTVDTAIARACEKLREQHVATIEIRQVGAGVKAARREVEELPLPLAQTCDWGDCDAQADHIRWSGSLGWLPVCKAHRGGAAETSREDSPS